MLGMRLLRVELDGGGSDAVEEELNTHSGTLENHLVGAGVQTTHVTGAWAVFRFGARDASRFEARGRLDADGLIVHPGAHHQN